MSHSFFRGTSLAQSGLQSVDVKLKKRLKVAKVCDVKVSMAKVKLPVISKWISERITDLLGFEDDIVINLAINFLEASPHPDPKQLQLDLTGFLEKQAGVFVEELWTLLVDAQGNEHGVPSVFVEKKKQELAATKLVRTLYIARLRDESLSLGFLPPSLTPSPRSSPLYHLEQQEQQQQQQQRPPLPFPPAAPTSAAALARARAEVAAAMLRYGTTLPLFFTHLA